MENLKNNKTAKDIALESVNKYIEVKNQDIVKCIDTIVEKIAPNLDRKDKYVMAELNVLMSNLGAIDKELMVMVETGIDGTANEVRAELETVTESESEVIEIKEA